MFLVLLFCAFFLNGCVQLPWGREVEHSAAGDSPVKEVFRPESPHAAFGNPSKATLDPTDRNNFLVVGNGSVFSYNESLGTVNWVSWRTVREDLGDPLMRPQFRPDLRLPQGFARIDYYDYSGSGYDRGHMVPSADRFGNARLNEETFMMTNIVPQTPALNQYPWQKLESHARSLVRRGNDVYQIAGVYGERERLKRKVTAPTNCWKVIVSVPRGRRIEELPNRMQIIAVDMPNIEKIENNDWKMYLTSISEIEERTGLDLFEQLPPLVQQRIETKFSIRSP
ncbi:DNA/RNA non-specific endonuclease [Leptolyngbya sp. 7M]|uniref:DNA/RNA non-specific endonuclease n=1 Tax=Leptolyngbya sp. 7M TaxID=2812896 RepID=UPI001B8A8DFF|nr:DNA/RNA non-specific endonuclease [Leptolyngbya sp. 7M]QYO65411.1 DNA/RNA non-specific endonuclease [Leptolyngbya sp. 7M]